MKDQLCQFEPSPKSSSATICKWCGKEKFLHTEKVIKTQIVPREITPAEFNKWINYIHRQTR
jgi:hypothetical protein